MFEDSLVESTGRIRTRSKWFAIGSFLLQASLLALLILIPFLYPAALPKAALTMMLEAPPPPPAQPELPAHATVTRAPRPMMIDALTAPNMIPRYAAIVDDRVPGTTELGPGDASNPGVMDALRRIGTPPALPVVVQPKPKTVPMRISAGVAAGQLLTPIRPVYPAIAREAHMQGTVVVEATISKLGTVEHARAVSGPPMLAGAALSAIEQARYQPYKLNGEPVEVETTINVVFTLSE